MLTGGNLKFAAIAVAGLVVTAAARQPAVAAISVTYHLQNAPALAAGRITRAVDTAVGVWNDWSNYNKAVNVYYNTGVPTAQANFDGVITFGAGSQYHNAETAWHEMLHVMGSGTYSTYWSHLSNGVWTGQQGIAMTRQYFPNNTLVGDDHVHWVGGGSVPPEQELSRQGVHILGAMRADMGLSNRSLYDLLGDFNNNGSVGRDDYLTLAANLYTNVATLSPVQAYVRGDMNGNRVIDDVDVAQFHEVFDLLGDFNGNGAVGLDDYEILLANFRTDVSALSRAEAYVLGDTNLNLSIDYTDFIAFRDSFRNANRAAAAELFGIVPEPSTILLLAVAWAGVCTRRPTRAMAHSSCRPA